MLQILMWRILAHVKALGSMLRVLLFCTFKNFGCPHANESLGQIPGHYGEINRPLWPEVVTLNWRKSPPLFSYVHISIPTLFILSLSTHTLVIGDVDHMLVLKDRLFFRPFRCTQGHIVTLLLGYLYFSGIMGCWIQPLRFLHGFSDLFVSTSSPAAYYYYSVQCLNFFSSKCTLEKLNYDLTFMRRWFSICAK